MSKLFEAAEPFYTQKKAPSLTSILKKLEFNAYPVIEQVIMDREDNCNISL